MQYDVSVHANVLDWVSLALVVVGAINRGLVGLGGFVGSNLDLVNLLLGGVPAVEALVYVLVGLAGLYELYFGYQLYAARREAPMTREKAA